MKPSLRLTPGMILRRGHYLYHIYYWIYTRITDHRLAGRPLTGTVFNQSPKAFPAQCISYHYIKELMSVIRLEETDVFVDVGCAWGRLLGFLHKHTKAKKLIGIELNEEIAAFAKNVFKDYERVEIIAGDVLEHIPKDATVFYLFNPFDETVLECFLKKVEETIHAPLRILYLHPTCRDAFHQRQSRWKLVSEDKLKPKHLGELTLCTYELLPIQDQNQ